MDASKPSAKRRAGIAAGLLLPIVAFVVLMAARTPTLTTPEGVCLAAYGANTLRDGGDPDWRVKSSQAETDRRVKVVMTTGCNDSTCTAVRPDRDWVAETGFATLRGCGL